MLFICDFIYVIIGDYVSTDAYVRTTINLREDLYQLLKRHSKRKGLSSVMNALNLRLILAKNMKNSVSSALKEERMSKKPSGGSKLEKRESGSKSKIRSGVAQPAEAQYTGRRRHAITVVGLLADTSRAWRLGC